MNLFWGKHSDVLSVRKSYTTQIPLSLPFALINHHQQGSYTDYRPQVRGHRSKSMTPRLLQT